MAAEYTWTFQQVWPSQPPLRWDFPTEDWEALGVFVHKVKWKVSPERQISYAELAVLFVLKGGRCQLMQDEHVTFRAIIRWLQGRLSFCRRKLSFALHPGLHVPRGPQCMG